MSDNLPVPITDYQHPSPVWWLRQRRYLHRKELEIQEIYRWADEQWAEAESLYRSLTGRPMSAAVKAEIRRKIATLGYLPQDIVRMEYGRPIALIKRCFRRLFGKE